MHWIFLTVDEILSQELRHCYAMDSSLLPFEQSHQEMVVHLLLPAEWSLLHYPLLHLHRPVMLNTETITEDLQTAQRGKGKV